jgi:beta-lactamase regulating signal transducer with metallopeptidase domain
MSAIPDSLNHFSSAVFAAVVNSLWQAAAIAFAAWIFTRFMPRMNAATRHIIWWAALVTILILPLAGLMPPTAAPVASEPLQSITEATPATPISLGPVGAPAVIEPPRARMEVRGGGWPTWIFALWTAILLLQLARVAWSYCHLRGVQRRSRPAPLVMRANFDAWMLSCRVGRAARLLISSEIRSPVAVGFRRPAAILPEQLLGEFQASELDHVLLHELAHIARRDDWSNLAARLSAGILALHPVAAWALARIEREREIACDDWVVSMTGAARPYAASLARLFELCSSRRSMVLASGMAESASHLGRRVEMLLQRSREFAPRPSATRIALSAAVLSILMIAGAHAPGWFAIAQDRPSPSPPEAAPALAARAVQQTPPAPATLRPAAAPKAQESSAPLPPDRNSFLDALAAAGYRDLSVDQLIEMKSVGISPDFIRGISEAGWGKLSPEEMIALAQRGVGPEYVRKMKTAGLKNLTLTDVMDLAAVGARPEKVEEIYSLGFGPYTPREIVEFTQRGVQPELFRALKETGFSRATPEEINEAASVGLRSGDLHEARQYGPKLTIEQIIKLKMAGVL